MIGFILTITIVVGAVILLLGMIEMAIWLLLLISLPLFLIITFYNGFSSGQFAFHFENTDDIFHAAVVVGGLILGAACFLRLFLMRKKK
jgi:energy-coupling factor transporter transmembrane protein EcfT